MNIDKTLKELIADIYSDGHDDIDLERYGIFDNYLAAIHKAYKDAGYKQYYRTDSQGNVTIPPTKEAVVIDMGAMFMTGAEWLGRFTKELRQLKNDDFIQSQYEDRNTDLKYLEVLEAAKRASGVSND